MYYYCYGIHTIDLSKTISNKTGKYLNNHLHTLAHDKGFKFYKDAFYQSQAGVERWICEWFKKHGVIIYLLVQRQSKNKTNKKMPATIILRVNPYTLIHDQFEPSATFEVTKKALVALENGINTLLEALSVSFTYSEMNISRIDNCLDYYPQTQAEVDELMRIAIRSPNPNGYKRCQFPKNMQNYKGKNKHSYRMRCKTVTLTIYDKTFEELEEKLISCFKDNGPMLRIEVSRASKSFKRGLSPELSGNNADILQGVWKEAKSIIACYLKKVDTGALHVTYKDAQKRIFSFKCKAGTRENMYSYLNAFHGRKYYDDAIVQSGLSTKELATVKKKFLQLGISPITLRKDSMFNEVPSIRSRIK